jgi:signal transduction histidine kinase
MKQEYLKLSERYLTALRNHLKPGASDGAQPARRLGRQAAALGLKPLELARIHGGALASLKVINGKNALSQRAKVFFTSADRVVAQANGGATQKKGGLNHLRETLGERTDQLAATHRRLQRCIVRRKLVEQAFAKSGRHHKKCLEESLLLQKRLRQLTHRVLAAQEIERQQVGKELQDEIAQTLLGINVRLLSLRQEARNNVKGFKNEIASTQRLVLSSAKSVRRAAREFRNP